MVSREQLILDEIRLASIKAFGGKLTGVYVHGSMALNCFHWDHSDIDFIVVLEDGPSQAQKEAYISALLDISERGPQKGLEMSVVLREYTRHFLYPTPYELHYSNAHLSRCREDLEGFCRQMNGTDKDLAAHFTIIRNACIVLCGAPAEDTFGNVPKECYRDSIRLDIEQAERDILEDPVYIILNLCRVLAYQSDGLFLSKKEGGLWGVEQIDARYREIIQAALDSYQHSLPFEAASDRERLTEFAGYAHRRIFSESGVEG